MRAKIIILFIFSSVLFLNSCTTENDPPVPPVATATPSTQTIDTGTATAISLNSSISSSTFSWTVVQTGVTGATPGSGAMISQTLSASGTVAGTAVYSIIPTFEGVSGTAILVTVTVKPKAAVVLPLATATPASQSIATGTATSIALTSSITGSTFSWTVVQSGVSGATAGTGSSINQTLTATGAAAGTATYSITPTSTGNAGTAISVIVTVNPPKVSYTANIKPLLTNLCKPCHVAGGYNPKFDQYAVAKSQISGIIDRVQRSSTGSGFMPQGGTKLSAENIALLKKWVTDGLSEN